MHPVTHVTSQASHKLTLALRDSVPSYDQCACLGMYTCTHIQVYVHTDIYTHEQILIMVDMEDGHRLEDTKNIRQ